MFKHRDYIKYRYCAIREIKGRHLLMSCNKNNTKEILLSIIIVNYNSLEYLKKCVESIYCFNDIGEKFEIIVVDNSENDEADIWMKDNHPECKFVNNENKGFGQANNVGSNIARGKYLLFLNPDTLLVEPILEFAISCFENDDKLGAFGLKLIDINGNKNTTFGWRLSMGLLTISFSKFCMKHDIFIPSKMFTSGADIFIRRDVFDDCGKFDENIFMYCEEADIANRINQIGYHISYFPQKKIIHLEGKSTSDNIAKKYKILLKTREYYCAKYNLNFYALLKKEYCYCSLKYYYMLLNKNNPYKEIREELKKYIIKYSKL